MRQPIHPNSPPLVFESQPLMLKFLATGKAPLLSEIDGRSGELCA